MSFFKRLTNIVKSNINYKGNIPEIDINAEEYEEIFRGEDVLEQAGRMEEDNLEREYYGILELEYGASFDKIKSSYKRLLKKYHPDLYHNKPDKLVIAKKVTEKLNEAYSYFEKKYM